MKPPEACPFCETDVFAGRIIRESELMVSIVSRPWFREGHSLVIPRRHIVQVGELAIEEAGEVMVELGRLSFALDQGYGTGIAQKYQPLQPQNGIKVNHLHFHVFPRIAQESGLFPVPEPNDFSAFTKPDDNEMMATLQALR